jgi:release factor glutamine methyltransferase
METIRSVRTKVTTLLKEHGIHNPVKESELMIEKVLSCNRTFVLSNPEYPVSEKQLKELIEMSFLRCNSRIPLQYILGNEIFYGYHIDVGRGCLVPRPETELLVENVLSKCNRGTFLDWGTGSGAISVALLGEAPGLSGVAVDRSPAALVWAWKNLKHNSVLDRCLVIHNCDPCRLPFRESSLDLIVSNPPYIQRIDIPELMPEVLWHEPLIALDGGEDGLDYYYILLELAKKLLKKKGRIVLEIGGVRQKEILEKQSFAELELEDIINDYSGISRIMSWVHV